MGQCRVPERAVDPINPRRTVARNCTPLPTGHSRAILASPPPSYWRKELTLFTAEQLFGEFEQGSNVLTFGAFLDRACLERAREREESARLALGAYVVCRLVGSMFARDGSAESDEAFEWQVTAVRRHLRSLPADTPESAHLSGISQEVSLTPATQVGTAAQPHGVRVFPGARGSARGSTRCACARLANAWRVRSRHGIRLDRALRRTIESITRAVEPGDEVLLRRGACGGAGERCDDAAAGPAGPRCSAPRYGQSPDGAGDRRGSRAGRFDGEPARDAGARLYRPRRGVLGRGKEDRGGAGELSGVPAHRGSVAADADTRRHRRLPRGVGRMRRRARGVRDRPACPRRAFWFGPTRCWN